MKSAVARAAVRRPRPRDPPAQGALPRRGRRRRRRKLLTVVGIAGIGKSRLAWEFEKYLDGLAERRLVAPRPLPRLRRRRLVLGARRDGADARAHRRGRARRTRRCRSCVAVLADAIPDEDRARLGRAAARAPAGARRAAVVRAAGSLLGLAPLLRAALRPVRRSCSSSRTCSGRTRSLLDFVEHLLDWSRAHPIFVLALTRPEIAERRPGWGSAGRSSTTLSLDPLSDRAMGELLEPLRARSARRARRARSSSARRACRSTRSRRCGCCSTAVCVAAGRRPLHDHRPIDRSRCRRRCTR